MTGAPTAHPVARSTFGSLPAFHHGGCGFVLQVLGLEEKQASRDTKATRRSADNDCCEG
jgi:hypothetical protein